MKYNTWKEFFNDISKKEYFQNLMTFVNHEYDTKVIFPKKEDMWNAFKFTALKDVKVVILGQDPYPNPNQAMGLAFSVNDGIALPRSLINIFKEMINEYKLEIEIPTSGNLSYLSKQGVLLLNPYLTVEAHKPLSHKIKEYDLLFKDIMNLLNESDNPIVFLLWGNNAKKYEKLLTNPKHLVVKTSHPSPLSANQGGWFNSNCFIKTNDYLKENGITPINWLNNIPCGLK